MRVLVKKLKNLACAAVKVVLKASLLGGLLIGVAHAGSGMANLKPSPSGGGPTAIGLTSLKKNIATTVSSLAVILTDVALIAGIGFIMASFFKFHQHKLNPTQVPISQGITLLLIGAGLTLFPTMLPTATHAIFGSASIGKLTGAQMTGLIGS